MWSFVRSRPRRRYDKAALVLSVLSLIVFIVIPYLALALSLAAAVALVASWVTMTPRTSVALWALLVTAIAVAWNIWYALTVPR